MVRFLPDGSRDTDFGDGGELVLGPETTTEGVEKLSFSERAMAIDARGRILVFGAQTDASQSFSPGGHGRSLSELGRRSPLQC